MEYPEHWMMCCYSEYRQYDLSVRGSEDSLTVTWKPERDRRMKCSINDNIHEVMYFKEGYKYKDTRKNYRLTFLLLILFCLSEPFLFIPTLNHERELPTSASPRWSTN